MVKLLSAIVDNVKYSAGFRNVLAAHRDAMTIRARRKSA